MPWPAKVLRQFEKVPFNPSEADFHGPYNKLLYTLFPADTDFTVVPQRMPDSSGSSDSFVRFEVMLEDRTVLVLALNPPGHLQYPSSREAADLQIRTRMRDLSPDCPFPVLYGVCAMGTKLYFYRKTRDQVIFPLRVLAHPELGTDALPRELWNCDILEDEGEEKFRAVVAEIKSAYKNMP